MSTEYIQEQRKPLEDMDVIDDFLFFEIMSDEEYGPDLCRMILELVIKRTLGTIRIVAQKALPGISTETHGIRMDAFVREIEEKSIEPPEITVYDIEPDKKSEHKDSLPKRSRYYGSLMDVQLLKTGKSYKNLPKQIIVFILSYDPFGKDAMYYEAARKLITHPEVEYDDGVRCVFLYIDGQLPEESGEDDRKLQKLLRYIGKSTLANVTDDNTRKLDEIVRRTKSKEGIGVRYMKSWEIRQEMFDEGMEKGLEEGRAEGREEKLRSMISKKIKKGYSIERIADELEEDIDTLKPVYDEVLATRL